MRTIKFRGKREDNGEWIYGDLGTYENDCVICDVDDGGYLPIIRETVGQFTGLYDNTQWEDLSEQERQKFYFENCSDDGVTIKYKTQEEVQHLWKGKEIYDGDIIASDISYNLEVFINEGHTQVRWFNLTEYLFQFYIKDEEVKIIGNIHDNKEIK